MKECVKKEIEKMTKKEKIFNKKELNKKILDIIKIKYIENKEEKLKAVSKLLRPGPSFLGSPFEENLIIKAFEIHRKSKENKYYDYAIGINFYYKWFFKDLDIKDKEFDAVKIMQELNLWSDLDEENERGVGWGQIYYDWGMNYDPIKTITTSFLIPYIEEIAKNNNIYPKRINIEKINKKRKDKDD